MAEHKFKCGDMVIPIDKTKGLRDLESSMVWRRAKERNQPFIFVCNWNEDEDAYCCDHYSNEASGDYYAESDLIHYTPTAESLFVLYVTNAIDQEQYKKLLSSV